MSTKTYEITFPLALGHDERLAEEVAILHANCYQADAWSLIEKGPKDWDLRLFYSDEAEMASAWKDIAETYEGSANVEPRVGFAPSPLLSYL